MVSLDDAFHKLERGKVHLSNFYKKIANVFNEEGFKVKVKSQPHLKPAYLCDARPWYAYTAYFSSVPVVSKDDGILLGEGIQCFRSSLDYLAWSLVSKHSRQPLRESQKRRVMFPMVSKRKSFWSNVNGLLPNVPNDQRAFFERYQPYRRSDIGRTIRHLKNLSNFDKHRIIIPTTMWPDYADIEFEYRNAQLIKEFRHYKTGRKIGKNTEIMTCVFAGAIPNKGQVKVNTKFTIYPMFPKTIVKPPPTDPAIPAQVVTDHISTVCTEILTEAANYF